MLCIKIKALRYLGLKTHGINSHLQIERLQRPTFLPPETRQEVEWWKGRDMTEGGDLRLRGRTWSNHICRRGDSAFLPCEQWRATRGPRQCLQRVQQPLGWAEPRNPSAVLVAPWQGLPMNSSQLDSHQLFSRYDACLRPRTLPFSKAQAIYRPPRWRVEPGYIRSDVWSSKLQHPLWVA